MSVGNRVYRVVIALLAVTGSFCLLVVYTPFSNIFAIPLYRSSASKATHADVADVIVVLSGGRYNDGSLNDAAVERTVTGVRLYRQGLAPHLLFTGGPCCGRSASSRMASLAAELGVPRSAILLEEESLRTSESARYSAELLRSSGMQSAILVTSSLHMLRAQLAFKAAGLSVHPVRATEKKLSLLSGAAERISLLQAAIHEYLGLAFYKLQGWI